jgi:putative DNA methylase
MALEPFEWKDKPALIEHLFPVQKISAESFKEQEARQNKTLTSLGS